MVCARASCWPSGWCSRIASTIWLPMLWTGLKEDIGSWKMSAISAPRIDRISAPFASSVARSTTAPVAGRRKWISPSTIRPGRSTIRRIDRAVTLLPHPLSPTIPSVAPGATSKLTPSTARTVPSSCAKYVFRFRTDRSGSASIRIRRVAQAVAQKVEGHDGDDHRYGRKHEPRRDGHRLDVLRLLQEHAPADGRRPEPEAEKAQRRLADDHR